MDPVNYYRVTYLVYAIGVAKDRGEAIYYFAKSLAERRGEMEPTAADKKVAEKVLYGKVSPEDQRVETEAHALYDYYERYRPLTFLRQEVQDWIQRQP
ncbi:MAG: hypothetical protein KDD61_02210 [Bdellovibrionales bacterium]|nr:hypothetical protein [Bdellovibrionales bacterium]